MSDSSIPIIGVLQVVENILDAVNQLPLEQAFREQLRNALSQSNQNNQSSSSVRQIYARVADKYLRLKQPFHWNHTNPHDPSNSQKDIEQFLELIEHCIFVGNSQILDRWGIYYLQTQGTEILAEDVDYYVGALGSLRHDVPPTAQPYLDHLIMALEEY